MQVETFTYFLNYYEHNIFRGFEFLESSSDSVNISDLCPYIFTVSHFYGVVKSFSTKSFPGKNEVRNFQYCYI